jgi:hypothetical protein
MTRLSRAKIGAGSFAPASFAANPAITPFRNNSLTILSLRRFVRRGSSLIGCSKVKQADHEISKQWQIFPPQLHRISETAFEAHRPSDKNRAYQNHFIDQPNSFGDQVRFDHDLNRINHHFPVC